MEGDFFASSFFASCLDDPSLLLIDIVIFGLSHPSFPSRFYNAPTRERFPHPYKECFVPLSNRCGISQSTPHRGPMSTLTLISLSNQCGISKSTPLQGSTSSLALIPLSNRCGISQSTPLQGSASSLAHRPLSGSDTICNN